MNIQAHAVVCCTCLCLWCDRLTVSSNAPRILINIAALSLFSDLLSKLVGYRVSPFCSCFQPLKNVQRNGFKTLFCCFSSSYPVNINTFLAVCTTRMPVHESSVSEATSQSYHLTVKWVTLDKGSPQ